MSHEEPCKECEGRPPYERSLPHFNLEDEVLKLKLIVQASKDAIYPSYLMEKLDHILEKKPISLDAQKQIEFNAIKDPEHYDIGAKAKADLP